MKKTIVLENVRLDKFVHGGQCIGYVLEDAYALEHVESQQSRPADTGSIGKKTLFVWGGLPGELVDVRITKKKSSYLEGIVTEVHEPSEDRIEPEEPLSYLSTSPWQIVRFDAENQAKQNILAETFEREHIDSIVWDNFVSGDKQLGYRNKQEMGFWGDEDGLHLAHYVRGSRGKQKVQGSALAVACINKSAREIRDELSRLGVWAGKFKTVAIRASEAGETVAALFVKEDMDLSDFRRPAGLKGIDIYYSDPKSPASVPTRKIYSLGDIKLTDSISGINITYDVLSFFQVNLPVFEQALKDIKTNIDSFKTTNKNLKVVDMYSGVGTIGIAVGADDLVESEGVNVSMAQKNITKSGVKVIHATSEKALSTITDQTIVIVDPPRAGLHPDVIKQILDAKPPYVIYLSCNPSTQSRDIKLCNGSYKVLYARGYNFFPRTPHIESLVVLELRV